MLHYPLKNITLQPTWIRWLMKSFCILLFCCNCCADSIYFFFNHETKLDPSNLSFMMIDDFSCSRQAGLSPVGKVNVVMLRFCKPQICGYKPLHFFMLPIYVTLGSDLCFMLWLCCACDLARFRCKNNLFRVRKGSCFGLKYCLFFCCH